MRNRSVHRVRMVHDTSVYQAGICLVVLVVSHQAFAQVGADSVQSFMPFGEDSTVANAVLFSSALDLTRSLNEDAAAFAYDFNAFGWPSAWSTYGISPHHISVRFNGIPFDDLVTGSPRYDLLPTALLKRPILSYGDMGAPVNVCAELREWAMGLPLTELHYQAGDHGLQRVTALHAQTQQRSLFRRPGRMQLLFAYAGAAAKGEYPGSRLRRFRQLLLRSRYQQAGWSLELLYLHNQRRLGAHGGVLGSESERYNRLIAVVRDSGAQRRLVRNDFVGILRVRALPGVRTPLAATMFVNTQTLRYTSAQDSVTQAVVQRGGLSVSQRFQVGKHQLRVHVEGWIDQVARATDMNRRPAQHISLADSLVWRRVRVSLGAGLHRVADLWKVSGSLEMQVNWETGHILAQAFRSLGQFGPVDTGGWGHYVQKRDDDVNEHTHVRLGVRQWVDAVSVAPYAFITHERFVTDYYEWQPDIALIDLFFTRTIGAGLRLTFRDAARRGVYAALSPWIMRSRPRQSAEIRSSALPRWGGSGRVGLRYLLFSGDLDLDVSLWGRWWGSFRSRILHAPTGLLILPELDRIGPLPASGTLDVYAEGDVRGATLFVAWENVLSGTPLLAGNEIISTYPLPARQLRFGVYWPILN